ncbi:FeoA family protein [Nitratifractor sp.]|uniref:FeoA family protein n=1 Tax=Nitratifractor sp. TaxID=2268144 RepID=UPI0025D04A79|nr:FeoA family protein [Nitratifractor sp.]
MQLTELKKGDRGTILRIQADPELRNRLHSFGIIPGEELEVKGCSLARQTMEIDVDGTLIALRKEEAEKIEVEKEAPGANS